MFDCRSGIGSYYGTLSGPVPALSPQVKPGKEYKSAGKNFYTNPGKKGTGYGYVDMNAYCQCLCDTVTLHIVTALLLLFGWRRHPSSSVQKCSSEN